MPNNMERETGNESAPAPLNDPPRTPPTQEPAKSFYFTPTFWWSATGLTFLYLTPAILGLLWIIYVWSESEATTLYNIVSFFRWIPTAVGRLPSEITAPIAGVIPIVVALYAKKRFDVDLEKLPQIEKDKIIIPRACAFIISALICIGFVSALLVIVFLDLSGSSISAMPGYPGLATFIVDGSKYLMTQIYVIVLLRFGISLR